MPKKKLHIESKVLRAGHTPDQETLSRAVPIYQTSSYVFRDTEHAADLFALRDFGNIYTRLMNPTTDVLEKRLAAITHGAAGAVATASGQAAIFYAIAAITSAGQNFVTGDKLYGGTYTQFEYSAQALRDRSPLRRLVHAGQLRGGDRREHPPALHGVHRQPQGQRRRLRGYRRGGAPAQDTPRRRQHGDAAAALQPVRSRGRHRRVLAHQDDRRSRHLHRRRGGGDGRFRLEGAGKFPEITEPDPCLSRGQFLGGPVLARGHTRHAFCVKLRTGLMRDIGAALSPFNSFLFLQGLETLPLRATAHCENAQRSPTFWRRIRS